MTSLAIFIASFGYSGYFPIAPGTAGSLAALVAYGIVRWFDLTRFEGVFILVAFVLGVWAANVVERHLRTADPGIVVIDEVVGMWLSVALIPVSIAGAILAFFVFRVFDVLKPFPARRSEALPGGYGIMVDDVFAGVYAHLVVRAAAWLWPAWMLQS
jgi:phosphatidylglycerophosphatase A